MITFQTEQLADGQWVAVVVNSGTASGIKGQNGSQGDCRSQGAGLRRNLHVLQRFASNVPGWPNTVFERHAADKA